MGLATHQQANRLLRQAAFSDPEANVIDIRYDADRKLDKVKIAELANCEWVKAHRNVLITGASGAGSRGSPALWASRPATRSTRCATRACPRCSTSSPYPGRGMAQIEEALHEVRCADSRRLAAGEDRGRPGPRAARDSRVKAQNGSLIICSQFSPAGWHAKLGEGAIADAVIDRIVYRSDVIHIEGDESMRKRIG